MASHKSAIKKNRQDLKHRLRNRAHASRLRTQVKKMRKALDAGDGSTAGAMVGETLSLIDRSVSKGVIHRNTAARTKSRLVRAVARTQGK